MTRPLPLALL
jgi:hypothetical protein